MNINLTNIMLTQPGGTETALTAANAASVGNISTAGSNIDIVYPSTPTTMLLSVSPNPANAGQTVTLSASVSPAGATGTVSFYDVTSARTPVALGTGTMLGGVATVNTSSLMPGLHAMAATYSGDANYGSNVIAPAVNLTVEASGQSAALSITKTHNGNFLQGQLGAAYSVVVSNAAPAAATSGTVTMTESVPPGLSLVSMAGVGWTCPSRGATCTRGDPLGAGASYPAIAVTVNVASNATSPQANSVAVSGGGSAPAGTTDSTTITASTTSGLAFYPVPPCRVADTRKTGGILNAGSTRNFNIPAGSCNIPVSAQAYSLNVTVVPQATLGYLTAWPAGQAQPIVSTLNSSNGAIIANAAILPAGASGAISVYASDATHVILDIDGYFAAPGSAGALAFYPATPCRVADTRTTTPLAAGGTRSFNVPASACNIPSTAQAYSLNMTTAPTGPLGYLTTWPTGQTQPVVSTLNALQGQIAANAAIVPAGANGAISVYVSDASNVIIDINGYFAAPGPGALYFYPLTPCRVADTRNAAGPFGGPSLGAGGSRTFTVTSSSCSVPASAQAYSLNMTVVPQASLLYLSTYPAGLPQPVVSTLNDIQGQIVANAAIVPAGTGSSVGGISVFVSDAANVIIDINGYFGQ